MITAVEEPPKRRRSLQLRLFAIHEFKNIVSKFINQDEK